MRAAPSAHPQQPTRDTSGAKFKSRVSVAAPDTIGSPPQRPQLPTVERLINFGRHQNRQIPLAIPSDGVHCVPESCTNRFGKHSIEIVSAARREPTSSLARSTRLAQRRRRRQIKTASKRPFVSDCPSVCLPVCLRDSQTARLKPIGR